MKTANVEINSIHLSCAGCCLLLEPAGSFCVWVTNTSSQLLLMPKLQSLQKTRSMWGKNTARQCCSQAPRVFIGLLVIAHTRFWAPLVPGTVV